MTQLPSDIHSYMPELFIGRDREMKALEQAFFKDGLRLVLITGKAGIGKTSIAAMFVNKYHNKFPGGVHWIEEQVDPLGLQSSIAPARDLLHIRSASELPTLAICEELHQYSDEMPSLPDKRLSMIFERYPKLQVLATSQTRLNWGKIGLTIELKPFTKDEFAELFKRNLSIANLGNLDELYRKITGLPLSAITASASVKDELIHLEELPAYAKPFKRHGILGPDGKPLKQKDERYRNVVSTIHVVNTEFLKRLSEKPSLLYELSPRQFEELVAELLERRGYDVTLTPASRDGGVDIYAAEKKDLGQFLYLVQCKKFRPERHIGVGMIRELLGTLELKEATAGILVTTSFFTKDAYELQQTLRFRISLQDYFGIQKWIKQGSIG